MHDQIDVFHLDLQCVPVNRQVSGLHGPMLLASQGPVRKIWSLGKVSREQGHELPWAAVAITVLRGRFCIMRPEHTRVKDGPQKTWKQ